MVYTGKYIVYSIIKYPGTKGTIVVGGYIVGDTTDISEGNTLQMRNERR